jgi:hypothetical protein
MLISINKLNLKTDTIIIWLEKIKLVNVTDLIFYYLHNSLNIRIIHLMQKE